MNSFTPGSSVADILIYPPSQYTLQKLNLFDFVKLWDFTLKGHMDVAKYSSKSQADDTFGLSRADEHLTVHSIASVRASCMALPNHQLPFSEFLSAKNIFLEHARKVEGPLDNLDALGKFFWFLETHPFCQLPLGEKIILTYTSHVRLDWHCEIKAGRGYNISVINHLLSSIMNKVKAFNDNCVKSKVSTNPPLSMNDTTDFFPSCHSHTPHLKYPPLPKNHPHPPPEHGAVDYIPPPCLSIDNELPRIC